MKQFMALFFIQVTNCKTCPSALLDLPKNKKKHTGSHHSFPSPCSCPFPQGYSLDAWESLLTSSQYFMNFHSNRLSLQKTPLVMPIGSFFVWLSYRKWLMLFSLKIQRDNSQNTLTVDPPRGKLEKRLYFSPHCGNETTTYITEPFVSATPHPQHSKIHNKSPENIPGLLLA